MDKVTRERNTMPPEDIAIIHRFVQYLCNKQDSYPEDKWHQAATSWACSDVWDCYRLGATWAIRCVYFYQNELDKPSLEWRPSIIMQMFLECARLTAETTGIPEVL